MPGYIFNWNPERFGFAELPSLLALLDAGEPARTTWSIGGRADAEFDTVAFLLRQGVEPKGIIGAGRIVSEPFDGPHWDSERAAEGATARRVVVSFADLLDATDPSTPPLPQSSSATRAEGFWRAQQSGTLVGDDIVEILIDEWEAHRQHLGDSKLAQGKLYKRMDLLRMLGLPERRGGPFFTGYAEHNGAWYIMPTVGAAGTTGHDYANCWVAADVLEWRGRTGSNKDHPSIQRIIASTATVHLLTRNNSREPFRYEGRIAAARVFDEVPVRIHWKLLDNPNRRPDPSDVGTRTTFLEGLLQERWSSARERDPGARRACLEHWGARCFACGMTFASIYGLHKERIEVHHLNPLAEQDGMSLTDPVKDMRPLCPNCHAAVHSQRPAMTIEALLELLGKHKAQ